MKHKFTHAVTFLCLFCLLITSLLGCSGNQTSTNTKKSEVPTMTASPTPTQQAATTSPAATATPTPENTIKNTEPFTLTWLGHAAVKLRSKAGKVVYIDPSGSSADFSDPADIVLVTHAHDDHKPSETLARKDTCIEITAAKALVDGVYQKFDYGDIQVEAVPAGGNGNHAVGSGVGYIVTVDGVTVYHAGDTSMIDEMKALTKRKLDYAMYPIDGLYNMNAIEATKVATLVGAKHNIPIHDFNDFNQHKEDKFTPNGKLVIPKGGTIYLEK